MAESVTVQRSLRRRIVVTIVVLTLVLVSTLAIASASFPAVSVTSGCNTLTPGTVPIVGQSGAIRFDCNSKAAFSANGNATPSFNITGTGYTSLAIVLHSSKNCTQSRTIKSGVTVSFGSSKGDYDYCAVFQDSSLAKLGSFKVTWSVGKA